MPDFLINVKSRWDASSVQAYAAEVEKAIKRIQSATKAAQSANGGAGRPANDEDKRRILGEQVRMETGLKGIRESGAVEPAAYRKLAAEKRKGLKAAADAAGVELLAGNARTKAVREYIAESARADKDEITTARDRGRRARDEAKSATPPPKRDPSASALREKRIQDEKDRKLRGQDRERLKQGLPDFDADLTYAERQRLLDPGLKEREREQNRHRGKKGAAKGDVAYDRDVLNNVDGLGDLVREHARLQAKINAIKAREAQAVFQQLRLTEESVRLTAKELVSRAGYMGNVNKLLAETPEDIKKLAKAKDQGQLRNERVGAATINLQDDERQRGDTARLARDVDNTVNAVKKKTVAAEASAATWEAISEDDRALAAMSAEARHRALVRKSLPDAEGRTGYQREAEKDERSARTADNARERKDRGRQAAAEKEITRAKEKIAKEEATRAEAARKAAEQEARYARPASLFQRAEARFRPGAPAAERPTLGQAVGGGIISAARFGAGAAVLYGTLNTIKEMVKESSDLERVFNQIQRQFEATGKAGDFAGFRKEIIEISKSTGQMATEVAFVGFQFQAAFGNGPGGAAFALEQTRAAIEIAKVTGLDLNELVDSLTASSISFGTSIEAVGDKALGIQERFGVQAKETLKFFGDLSAVAADAGLNLDQLGAIAGAVQQATGKSGSALAEGLGRIIPGIQEASVELVRFYQQTPELAKLAPDLAAAAGTGNTGAVLERLIRDYHLLSDAQKKQVVTLLGGRREAQILIPILENSAKVVQELDGQLSGLDSAYDDTGKSAKYFADLQETLAQKVSQLAREFEAFGQKLFEAGLGDVLKDIAGVAGVLLQVIALLAKGMAAFNTATGGAAIKVVELVVGMRLLLALGTKLNLAKFVLGSITPAITSAGKPIRAGGLANFAAGRVAAGRAAASGTSVVARGVTGGAAALGITPVTAGAVAVAAGFAVYQERTAKLEAAATKFRENLATIDKEELIRLRESRERKLAFWERLWVNLPGGPTASPEEELDKEIQKRENASLIHDFEAVNKAGLLKGRSGGDPKNVAKLIAAARQGDKEALEIIGLALIDLRDESNGSVEQSIQDFDKAAQTNNTVEKVKSGEFMQSVQAAEAAYAAGQISSSDYLKVLASARSAYELTLGRAGTLTDAQAKELAGIMKKSAEFQSGKLREFDDYQISIETLNGGDKNATTVSTLTRRLQDPNFTDASERLKAAKDIVAAQDAITAQRVAGEESAVAQLEIMEAGSEIPDVARIAILENGIIAVGTQWQAFLQAVTGDMKSSIELGQRIAKLAIEAKISVKEASRRILTDMLNFAKTQVSYWQTTQDESTLSHWEMEVYNISNRLKEIDAQPDVKIPGKTSKPDADALKKQRSAAAKEKETKAKEAHKVEEETAKARLALRKAQAEGDPIAQADIAIEEAKYSESIASTAAEHLDAARQLIEANRAKAEAQASVADAYRSVDAALAEAAGDSVRAAQIELEGIQRNLEEAKARGDKIGAVKLQAQLIAQQRAVDQESLSSAEQDIDFYREMGQATLGQTIAAYEALLPLAAKNKDDYQALILKINALRKEGSENTAFNTPSEIKLPTLYEVRRLRQTQAAGIDYGVGSNYQDNRQIMVQYNVMTAQDNQAALDDLLAVTSGQPRVGSFPRGY